ncbi:MAG: PAS domain-containing protein [Candidatus Melainabacteria bacterium]|nr:MAG: PAS domain-containing protein [Candidatus Melainabacteria bacterium]
MFDVFKVRLMTRKDAIEQEFLEPLTEQEIDTRQKWLEFEKIEPGQLEAIDLLLQNCVDDLMDAMYEHFLSFPETRDFFPNEHVIQRAKQAQKQYFLRLAHGAHDRAYVADRLKVGLTHHRIDLEPKWYIGAYNKAVSWLLPRLLEKCEPGTECETMASMMRLIFFDMSLAIESYIKSKEFALLIHRDAIRELETEKRVTKSILESAPIGIVNLDEHFVCLECNEEFAKLLSCASTREVIGKSFFELSPFVPRKVFEDVLLTATPARFSANALNLSSEKTLEVSYWDWAVWPTKDGSGATTGLVAMFANATDRVQLQQQREDFVATLTHDLKTPVSATNRAVKLLLDGDFGEVNAEQREILSTLLQSNTTLYGLVQTLLDVYRFDSGVKEMRMTPCDLSSIVTQFVTEVMPLAEERKIQLITVLPDRIKEIPCDKEEIRRVIQNLIDNSLKFTPGGGRIQVELFQNDDVTTLTVSDTGKGIPPENMAKLFQRFWQAGSSGRYYASTGLGLYLSRKIVEGHGGQIWCESQIGKGSQFTVELPSQ